MFEYNIYTSAISVEETTVVGQGLDTYLGGVFRKEKWERAETLLQ